MEQLVRVQPLNRLIKTQAVMLVLTVLIVFSIQGVYEAAASLYGSCMVIANTLLQKWHLLRAVKSAKSDASMNLRRVYQCVAQRWLLTIVLFIIGFTVVAMSPVYLMIGFVSTQFALLFGNLNRA